MVELFTFTSEELALEPIDLPGEDQNLILQLLVLLL